MFARFRPIQPYLSRYKARFVVGFICLIIGQTVGALIGLAIKAGVDDLMHQAVLRRLAVVAAVLIGMSLVKAVFQF